MTTPDIGERDIDDAEKAGRHAVRRKARGMSHHEVATAIDDARGRTPGDDEDATDGNGSDGRGEDQERARARAELAEWERIEALLAVHAGSYDPDTDAFVQGGLAGEADRRAAERADQLGGADGSGRTSTTDADRAVQTLLRALADAGVLDGSADEVETTATAARLAQADPAAAVAVSGWLHTASDRSAGP
jgi:hypothetical protein